MTTTMEPTLPATDANVADTATDEKPDLLLTCKQADLARALSLVRNAVLEHSTAPVLKGIQIATDGNRLRVSATNLEIGIQVWIDAQIQHHNMTVLPATLLYQLVSKLPATDLTLKLPAGSQTLNVTCVGTDTNIRSLTDRDQFPAIPGIDAGQQSEIITLDAGLLKGMISQVAFAAEDDAAKAVMSSVYMRFEGGNLTLVAADTYRLAERKAPIPGVQAAQPVLIPAGNLTELVHILPTQGQVQVVVVGEKRNQVVFRIQQGDTINFVTRVNEGTYANYEQFIPKEFATKAVVNTKEFADALARASLYAVDQHKSVRITVRGAGIGGSLLGSLTIEADDADLGNHVSAIQADVSGAVQEQSLLFSVKYLIEHLNHIDAPQVAFEVIKQGRPCILKPVSGAQYISMLQTLHVKSQG
jgi:DNA polymerase III subunit beta